MSNIAKVRTIFNLTKTTLRGRMNISGDMRASILSDLRHARSYLLEELDQRKNAGIFQWLFSFFRIQKEKQVLENVIAEVVNVLDIFKDIPIGRFLSNEEKALYLQGVANILTECEEELFEIG